MLYCRPIDRDIGRLSSLGNASGRRFAQRAATLCLSAILAGCGDGNTRICFSTNGYCQLAFAANESPHADAGQDQSVVEGTTVMLDGSNSRDPDGTIDTYAWVQTSGTPVAITGANTAKPTFLAPGVTEVVTLVFRLTVTDKPGASDSDLVDVAVSPASLGALQAGMTLLKEVYSPVEVARDDAEGGSAFVGLWLAVRVRAVELGLEENIDRLLDEMRMLSQLRVGFPMRGPEADDTEVRTSLFALGQSELAAFTIERDPAVSAQALQSCGEIAPIATETWLAALAKAGVDPTPASMKLFEKRREAARILLAADVPTSPAAVASAMLILLLPDTN